MRKHLKACLAPILICVVTASYGRGLFESASSESSAGNSAESKPVELGGYIKGALFGGHNNDGDAALTGAYAQTALKLDLKRSGIARAFAEARLNAGYNREAPFVDLDIREAWGCVSPAIFDLKLGRQIIAWGRADGINPTNNITPRDQSALSSEYDDTRLGNELLSASVKLGPTSLQGIWIPYYRPDVLPISGAKLPASVTIASPVYPNHKIRNSGCAFRLDCALSSFDGSISYFNGYATLPGFDYALSQTGILLMPRAYRMQAIGADFSTSIGSFGLRGEAAVKIPDEDYGQNVYVPNTNFQYVVGIDRTVGNWSILAQYSGVYVHDYLDIVKPQLTNPFDPVAQIQYAVQAAACEMERLNRLFTGTSHETGHSITAQVQCNAQYETLHMRLSGMYSITTRDYAINPDVTYDISDAVGISVGGRYLDGPDGALNEMVSDLMSFVYAELKLSF